MDINIKNIFDDSEIDIDKKIKNDNVEKESIKKDQDENTFNIENILLEKKIVTQDQIDVALKEKREKNLSDSIPNILIKMGLVTDSIISDIINENSKNKNIDLKSLIIDTRLIHKIPKNFAIQNKVIPISLLNNVVTIAISDLYDIITLDQIKRFFPSNFKIEPIFCTESEILKMINQYYDYDMSIDKIIKELESNDVEYSEEDLHKDNYKSPIIRLVDLLLSDAVRNKASDLHFEPEEFFLRLRYRIDGKMEQVRTFHNKYWSSIAVRIKIMSGMNIAETRKPQDGRIQTVIFGRKIDFRVSSHPTIFGENIVMRILDEKQSILSLDKLGFTPLHKELVNRSLKRPDGIIILTGPTGSGKTTTLYTMLNMINNIDINIMTLENPVEYRLPMVRQSNINPEIGVTFAEGIRTLLRQDPDVILVGEIRDEETALAAVQASMTGHQVFSSLHTNDAFSAIPRLLQIGVKPYLLSGSLSLVVAQRLARVICPHCKEEYEILPEEKEVLTRILGEKEMENVTTLYKGKGCPKCRGRGFIGRIAIIEIISIDKELDDMIVREARKKEMVEYLDSIGFISMQVDGARKVLNGVTTFDEFHRCVNLTDYIKIKS